MLKQTYSRTKAKELLSHYFRLFAIRTGTGWDYDNESEVEELVDSLIEAVVEELKQQLQEAKP